MLCHCLISRLLLFFGQGQLSYVWWGRHCGTFARVPKWSVGTRESAPLLDELNYILTWKPLWQWFSLGWGLIRKWNALVLPRLGSLSLPFYQARLVDTQSFLGKWALLSVDITYCPRVCAAQRVFEHKSLVRGVCFACSSHSACHRGCSVSQAVAILEPHRK